MRKRCCAITRSDVTKITLENESGTYSVSIQHDKLDMGEVVEYLLNPVLMAAGYGDEPITVVFAEQEAI